MTPHPLSRLARILSLFVCAAAVSMLGMSLFEGGAKLMPSASAATGESKAKAKDNYDLSSIEVLRKVVISIKDNYVDPKRVEPKEMFMAALEAVEKSTAEVMVEGNAKDGHVKVTCGNAVKEFKFDDVESVWMIPHRIKPIFAFIQENLISTTNKRDIEYAAVNGMLSTLDPHSWFLNPQLYREMQITTKGEFGGLGFVIAMDEDRLTVKKVLKNTPASRAGIKKADQISRIEDESTVNMDLNDAVSKLRGKPGTEVKIWVRRAGEEEKQYRLTRDLISIESVTSQLLVGNVGYVRLAQFAGTTSRDLAAAIRDLKAQAAKAGNGGKLKGLVMDLRSNPGGLLEQAIQVADQFVEEGTIVTTAGTNGAGDKLREPKLARKDGGEKEFPLAVLVNSESASASEIVAGALKNLDRAVIVGRQTFGKGSVQVLYDMQVPDPTPKEEKAALKLTIAQYLTPGDKSIQEIGVTPDIELLPARITKDRVDVFAPPRLLREADLDKHFANGFQPEVAAKKVLESPDKPLVTLRYLKEEKVAKKKADKEKDLAAAAEDADDAEEAAPEEPDEDQVSSDLQVQFARDLVLAAPRTERTTMLEAAKSFLADRQAIEDGKIEKAVNALGVDWTVDANKPGPGMVSAVADVKISPAKPMAGEFVTLTATVENTGSTPFERLYGYTKCDAEKTAYQEFCRVLDRREFLFGRVKPGEKKSWSTQVKVANHLPATAEDLTLVFREAFNNTPEDRKFEVQSVESARPAFAFTYQVLSRDGLAEPGESVDVQVDVKNTGTGKSSKNTYVSFRNPGNERIFMKKGRVSLGAISPGETKTGTMTLEVKPGFDASEGVPLKIEIGDRDLWEFTTGEVALPALVKPPTLSDASGNFHTSRDAQVFAAPLVSSPVLADAKRGASLPVLAQVGDFYKVEWAKGRTGFIKSADGSEESGARAGRSEGKIIASMQREPPVITLQGIDTSKSAVIVDGDHFKLSGTASDPGGVQDVRIFVNNEKVFFRTAGSSTPGEAAPKGGKALANKLAFTTEFPLKTGNNAVLVVAREDNDFLSQHTLIIHRRGPTLAESARKTPVPANP
jgi:carboxyl-terminal processing protease